MSKNIAVWKFDTELKSALTFRFTQLKEKTLRYRKY